MENNTNNSLMHYGVLGMKWGIRKDGKPQGYQSKGKNVHRHAADALNKRAKKLKQEGKEKEAKVARTLAKKQTEQARRSEVKKKRQQQVKNRSILSEADLDKITDRLIKEKKLKDLSDEQVTPGKKALKSTLSKTASKLAVPVATAVATAAITTLAVKYNDKVRDVDLIKLANDVHKMATAVKK